MKRVGGDPRTTPPRPRVSGVAAVVVAVMVAAVHSAHTVCCIAHS